MLHLEGVVGTEVVIEEPTCDGVMDECGVCDDDSENDCVEDCAGVWGGDAVEDNCGVCDNNSDNDNTTCLAANSSLYFNLGNAPAMGDVSAATGSYFGMEAMGPGQWLYINVESNDGLKISQMQSASGSHGGMPNGTETAGIDNAWMFFGNTGMHFTSSPVNILSDDNEGNVTLDMSGWTVTWNGIDSIPMGGCQYGDTANNSGFSGCDTNQDGTDELVDSSKAVLSCENTCADGESFSFDYNAHVPVGDPSNFGGVSYMLRLEGTICSGVIDTCGVCNGDDSNCN